MKELVNTQLKPQSIMVEDAEASISNLAVGKNNLIILFFLVLIYDLHLISEDSTCLPLLEYFSAPSILENFANIKVLSAVFTLTNLKTSPKVSTVIISIIIIIIDNCK